MLKDYSHLSCPRHYRKMSFFSWGNGEPSNQDHLRRNLQDGLFQIASQACHILVQIQWQSCRDGVDSSGSGVSISTSVPTSASTGKSATSKSFATKAFSRTTTERDEVVLLPHRKNRTPRLTHKFSTVFENARVDIASPNVDDDLELWDQTSFMLRTDIDNHLMHSKWGARGWCRPSCIPISIILILIVLVVLLPLLDHAEHKHMNNSNLLRNKSELMCMNSCKMSLVESIPIGLIYNNSIIHKSTYLAWMDLIHSAQSTIEIASLYWTMNRQDVYPDDSAKEGEDVFEALLEAGRDRGIIIKIVQNTPSQLSPNVDTEYLRKKAYAEVRSLNFAALLGGGILHTKLWIIDRSHVYVGSANMDWRSLTQVKELGLYAINCSCLANDLAKIFEVYWQLGEEGQIPPFWPDALSTNINMNNMLHFTLDNNKYQSFIANSPAPLSPKGRTNDLDAILHCIGKAEQFIYISVMDYVPLTIYSPKVKYWPIIDNALRSAAIDRRITIKLLISWWKHSRTSEDHFLQSLTVLTHSYKYVNIEVKRFIVPTTPDLDKIPFSRVNHNKYMVTDIAAYIGTSNWSGDYFINTAGIGVVFEDVGHKNNQSIRQQLEEIFHRDWNSSYAHLFNTSCSKTLVSSLKPQMNHFLPTHHI